MVLSAVVAITLVISSFNYASAQEAQLRPCQGGCDGEYPVTYDVAYMRANYGYPTYYNGCWWYDGREVDGLWWYMCPTGTAEPHNLYSYDPYA